MPVDLSAAKATVNAEVNKDLLYFICNDKGRDKVPSRVIDPSQGETFLIVLFWRPVL